MNQKDFLYKSTKPILCSDEDIYDNDDDGISNNCEINGYTIENFQIVKWEDERHQNKGFVKYLSDPNKKSTTGDPYSDSDKILKLVDPNILPEALHPLVAACPEIIVNMEQVIISNNSNVTSEKGKTKGTERSNTVSKNTTNSHLDSHTLGTKTNLEYSLPDGLSVTESINYSYEWNNTVTIDNTKTGTEGEETGDSWNETINLDKGKTAYLNANVRYINVGTAPVYNLQPTLSFVLGKNKDSETVATVTAKSNSTANVLLPNDFYPHKSLNPIAFHTNDDFNWQSIILNYEQVEKFNKGQVLQLQSTQFWGLYGTWNIDNQTINVDKEHNYWNNAISNIYGRTACITIFLNNGITQRRRVSARKSKNYYNQSQPEITLKEALKIAFFDIKVNYFEKEITISYKNEPEYSAKITIDKNSFNELEKQKEINSIFDVKLTQGMNIVIVQQKEKIDREVFDKVMNFFEENYNFSIEPYDYFEPWSVALSKIESLINEKFQLLNLNKIKISCSNNNEIINNEISKLAKIEIFKSAKKPLSKFIIIEFEKNKSKKTSINFNFSYQELKIVTKLKQNFETFFTSFERMWGKVEDILDRMNRDKEYKKMVLAEIFYGKGVKLQNVKNKFEFKIIDKFELKKFPWWK